ncbi:MAG: hypothetical protein ACFFAU_13765, partial [Candidatus Hodarchaeota archaeon]
MRIRKKFISSVFISLFCLNILIIVFPIQNEDFINSNEVRAEFLRNIGLIKRDQISYHMVPTLSSTDPIQQSQNTVKQQGITDLDSSEQSNVISFNDSNSFSGDSANNQYPPCIRSPSFAINELNDGTVGIYDSAWNSISGTTISVNLNSSGSNLMAIAILGMNNRDYIATITSVTFNGDSLTNLGTAEEAEDAHVSIWYLKNPDQGTGLSFSITFNQSLYYPAAASAWFGILDDVNLTNTFGPVTTYNTGTENDTQIDVTSTSGDRVFGAIAGETTGHWSVYSPSTELYYYDESTNRVNTAAANGNATGSSYTFHWTAPLPDHIAAIGVAIHPFIDNTPPFINDFGVDDPGTGNPQFWANVTDKSSSVANVTLNLNGTLYDMNLNGSNYWVYQPSFQINFNDYFTYQISNSSDEWGNYLATSSSVKNITFNYDTVAPSVIDWKYYSSIGIYGTFKANVSDSWGTIDTVMINVTENNGIPRNDLLATMVYYNTFSGTKHAYMNDTLVMENGPINFQIIINDTSGNQFSSSTHSGNVYINTAPVASDLTLSRDQFQVLLPIFSNSTLYLDYTYYDEEAQPEDGTEIRWYKDNGTGFTLQINRNDSTSIPESALHKGDQWYATVKPKDGELFGTLVNSSIITVKNTPPQISSLVILPSNPKTTQQLTASNSTTDHDGDPITAYEVRWYNPNLNSSYTNLSTITSDQTSKGETWWCELRAYDGFNYSVWLKSNNVTIENSAPSVNSLDLTPTNPKTSNTLTATYSYLDADNDAESGSMIRWYKDSILQGDLNDSLTVNSSLTSKGENWYFTVTPYDGSDPGSLQQSPTVTIENTAPEATSLQITPTTPQTANTLTASYTFNDNDTDNETGSLYIWYKNGILQGALNDSINVSSSYTSKGEVWHFKVRPSDGTDYGNWISCPTNVTIGNSDPSASNANIAPGSPKTGDALTATYDYSDPDSDPESGSEIIWYV